MRQAEYENKQRDKEIADNEATRSVASQARLSVWAVMIFGVLALATAFYILAK